MSTHETRAASDVFLTVCDLHGEAQECAIERECGDDPQLKARVERMLEADREPEPKYQPTHMMKSLARVLLDLAGELNEEVPQIEGFKVGKCIGVGGMGLVYEARQTKLDRPVAIKVVGSPFIPNNADDRLREEARILGRLHHSGIATVYDADVYITPLGPRSFFAMELVEGEPLIEYASGRGLDIDQRLELMARVCDAVQHAHAMGIAHHDLKPQNILVVEPEEGDSDSPGMPKILDFGIARVCSGEGATMRAEALCPGTPPYASPEQVAQAGADARADIYAIGVLIDQLVSSDEGFLERWHAETAVDLQVPDAPLKRRNRSRATGDLRAIIAKCVEVEPERRYQTADAVGRDLRACLNEDPVHARKPWPRHYLLRKWAKRNAAIAYGAIALVLVMLIAIVCVSVLYSRAETARRHTDAYADFTDRVLADLGEMGPAIPLGEFVDTASRVVRIDVKDGVVVARVLHGLGALALAFDDYASAERMLREALERREQAFGPKDPRTLDTKHHLAAALRGLGRLDDARNLFAQVVAELGDALGDTDPRTLVAMADYAECLRLVGETEQSERIIKEVISKLDRAAVGDTAYREVEVNVAGLLWYRSMQDDARAQVTEEKGDVGGAQVLKRSAVEDMDKAVAMMRRLLSASEAAVGRGNPRTARDMHDLALFIFHRAGMKGVQPSEKRRLLEQAKDLAEEALHTRRRVLGEGHPLTLMSELQLGMVLAEQGDEKKAEPLFWHAAKASASRLGSHHVWSAMAAGNLGEFLMGQNRLEEAEPYLVTAYTVLRERKSQGDPARSWAAGLVRDLYDKLGTPERARTLLGKGEPELQ